MADACPARLYSAKRRSDYSAVWEGRAEMATRDGDSRWDQQAIAARLAEALFDGFPTRNDGA